MTDADATYFRPLSIEAFKDEVARFAWTRRVWRVDMHHTFAPDHARWREIGSATCCAGMWRHHVIERSFEDIAQHVTIAPDGLMWTGRNWNKTPASVGYGMNVGAFMFEMIGNFDIGADVLAGPQLEATVALVDIVQRRFALPPWALLFHRDVPQTEKSCPGTSLLKSEIIDMVRARRRLA